MKICFLNKASFLVNSADMLMHIKCMCSVLNAASQFLRWMKVLSFLGFHTVLLSLWFVEEV